MTTLNPPPVLAGARLLAYAIVDDASSYLGNSNLYVDGRQLGRVPGLAIAQQATGSTLLLFCDDQWNPIGVSECASLADAQKRAEQEYRDLTWVTTLVSEQEAEQYLKNQGKDFGCSFCGRAAESVGQLFSSNNVYICGLCVKDFYRMLDD